MAKANETTVLVEMAWGEPEHRIMRVVRTYLSHKRAEQDLELLRDLSPKGCIYEIMTVEHIDD